MNIDELINRVKTNDECACKELFEYYRKMIYSIINEYDLDFGDYSVNQDDLYQEALIGIYDACKAYKFDKNAKFSTFAYVVVKRKTNKFYYEQIKRYANEAYSIDKIESIDHKEAFKSVYVEDNPIAYYKKEEFKKYINTFNELDRQIIKLRIENYSYDQIAHILNINKKKVDNRLYKLKKKFLERTK